MGDPAEAQGLSAHRPLGRASSLQVSRRLVEVLPSLVDEVPAARRQPLLYRRDRSVVGSATTVVH